MTLEFNFTLHVHVYSLVSFEVACEHVRHVAFVTQRVSYALVSKVRVNLCLWKLPSMAYRL